MGRNLIINFFISLGLVIAKCFMVMTLAFFICISLPGLIDNETLTKKESQNVIFEYQNWVKGLQHFEFGYSKLNPEIEITDLAFQPLKESLKLASVCLLLIVFSVVLLLALEIQFPKIRRGIETFVSLAQALPLFLVAPILAYLFAIKLNWLPLALWESPLSVALPAMVLSVRPIANLYRLLNLEMNRTFKMDFVRTAIAKGLNKSQVFFSHVLRPSMSAAITYFAQIATSLMTGSILVEHLFAIPGLGALFIEGLSQRDTLLVVFLCGLYSIILQMLNLAAQFLRESLDPRLTFSK